MSVTEFSANPARVAALKDGVATMKSRKPSDPTGWFFQAAIHAVSAEAVAQAATEDPGISDVGQGKFWN